MASITELVEAIGSKLQPLGFVPYEISLPGLEVAAVWRRRTWNTNRAVVVLEMMEPIHPGQWVREHRADLGKAIGYWVFFYVLGLQVVVVGPDAVARAEDLERYVDKLDNQSCIVQSLFVVDLAAGLSTEARTWGQVLTGKYQDAVAAALRQVLAS